MRVTADGDVIEDFADIDFVVIPLPAIVQRPEKTRRVIRRFNAVEEDL